MYLFVLQIDVQHHAASQSRHTMWGQESASDNILCRTRLRRETELVQMNPKLPRHDMEFLPLIGLRYDCTAILSEIPCACRGMEKVLASTSSLTFQTETLRGKDGMIDGHLLKLRRLHSL